MVGFVSYNLENDKAFKEAIEGAFLKTADLRIPFSLIAKDFYRSQKAIFKLSGPGKYPPFKGPKIKETWSTGPRARPEKRTRNGSMTAYQNFKIKNYGFDYPLLKAEGRLEKSITSGKGGDSILVITKASLIIGTRVPYANYHQQDNPDLGSKKIPLRKFLFIGPEAPENVPATRGRLDRWLKIIQNHINPNNKGKK